MQDIYKILKDQDIEIEDKDKFEKAFFENYKTVAEFEKKTNEVNSLKETLQERDDDLKELKKQVDESGDTSESLKATQQKLDELQKNYAQAEKEHKENLAKQEREFAVREYAGNLKFSSNAAKEHFTNKAIASEMALQDGKLLGMEDFVKSYKEADETAFADTEPENKAHFATKNGGKVDPKSGEDNKNSRPLMGHVR